MASDFKVPVKLTVDGESDFKSAMKSCSDSMALLSSEGKKVSAQFADNKSNLKGLTEQYTIAKEKLELQRSKVKALREELEKEVKANSESSKRAQELAKQLNNAEASEAKMERSVKEATKQMLTQNKAFQTASKVCEGLGKALKVTAAASVAAFGAMATGAIAAGKAIYGAAESSAEYGDSVDKASQKMGVSAEQYQQLAYAADLAGTSTSTLQKATQKLQASSSDLNMDEALQQLYAIEDADERAAKAHEMFGDKIANELAPMLNQGGEAFEAVKQSAIDYGLVMSDAAVKASAAFSDTKTTMVDTLSSIKNNIAAELLPGLNDVMSGITDLFTGKEGAAGKIEKGVKGVIEGLSTASEKIVNILNNIIPVVVELAPKIITTLVEGILGNLDQLVDSALELVDALVNGLLTQENIQTIMNGAVSIVVKLVDFLSKNAGLLVNAACTIVTSLIGAFSDPDNMSTLINGSIDMIESIVTALIDNAPLLVSAALEMGKTLVTSLAEYDWLSLAKNIYSSIKSSIIGLFKKNNSEDGSHAGGIYDVPFNGYSATLHKGERVLTAAEADAMRNNSNDISQLNAKVDYLMQNQQSGDVNVNISGSAGAVVRALNVEIEREGKRKSAFA